MGDLCLAVDVGGTKLAVALVGEDGAVAGHVRAPTPRTASAEDLFEALSALVADQLGVVRSGGLGGQVTCCGVGCGGPMSVEDGTVSPLNIPAWRDFPLVQRLCELTDLEVALDNDAKALALGEGWRGAARGCQAFMGMVVSTGVGGGIVLDGRLLQGASGNAGHVGHVIVEPQGRMCPCGARGCLEAEASGTAISEVTGGAPKDAPAAVVARTGTLVGRAVASVVSLLDLDLTVVGGSVALGFGRPFFEAANDELKSRARLSYARSARIVPTGLGEMAPLIGAAAVGWIASGRELL
jgi:glucokinase